MTDKIEIKAGELLMLEQGAYSDREVGLHVALKDFDILKTEAEFREGWVENEYQSKPYQSDFMRHLEMNGYIATPAHRYIGLGNYDLGIKEYDNITRPGDSNDTEN